MSAKRKTSYECLGIQELANEWGMGYDHVYDLVTEGRIKAFKAGRTWRIRRCAIQAYEAANSNILPSKRGTAA